MFVTGDSTFIRVEADTVAGTWAAFFADGTQVTGPILAPTDPTFGDQHAIDSDATQVRDRNGNTLAITGNCAIGAACTERLTDAQGRQIVMSYGTNPSGSPTTTWSDQITFPGANGTLTTVVNWRNAAPFALPYYCQTNADGTVNMTGICNLKQNVPGVETVQVPGGRNFSFYYGPVDGNYSWGEVHGITLCTGPSPADCQAQWQVGYVYAYDNLSSLNATTQTAAAERPPASVVNPLKQKTLVYGEYLQGANTRVVEPTSYLVPMPNPVSSFNLLTYPLAATGASSLATSEVIYPDGSYSETFTLNLCAAGVKSRDLCPALPYKVIQRDGSTTEMKWVSNATLPPGVSSGSMFNPFAQYRVDKALNAAVSKITAMQQDQYGNTTSVDEYGWAPDNSTTSAVVRGGSPSQVTGICPGGQTGYCAPARSNTAVFALSGQPYWTLGLSGVLRNPSTVTSGGIATSYTYDGAGNRLSSTRAGVTTSATYASNGNVLSTTDAKGNQTLISYGCGGLYAASVTAPGGLVTRYSFDCTRGTLGQTTTVTGTTSTIVRTMTYDDVGRRVGMTETAGSLSRTTSTIYDDRGLAVTTQADDILPARLTNTTYYDPLGRVIAIVDPLGKRVEKAYRYGSNGVSYELTSNPYGTTSESTMGWTLTTVDTGVSATPGGSGVASSTTTSYVGANVPAPWGNDAGRTLNTTTNGSASSSRRTTTDTTYPGSYADLSNCPGAGGYSGVAAVSVDPAGAARMNCVDGLGRLVAVLEPNGMLTSYGYDALDNITAVSSQCIAGCNPVGSTGQTRSFTYDNLSRMLSANNPENGLVNYSYDNNGNLTQRADALHTIQFTYDALDRPTAKCYGTGTCSPQTAAAIYSYDADFLGALSAVSTAASTTAFSHDSLGRIAASVQTTDGISYPFTYQYTLTDALTRVVYPSGRQMDYTLNGADQTVELKGTRSGVQTTYATALSYTAAGNMSSMTFGNTTTEARTYNNRMQTTHITAGSSLDLQYWYCDNGAANCASGNTGSPWRQMVTSGGQTGVQEYRHDALNRVGTAEGRTGSSGFTPTCPGGGGSLWCEQYGYDRSGNRNVVLSTPVWPDTPHNFSEASNRITDSGFGYDAVGNLVKMPFTTQGTSTAMMGYDAENRMVVFCPNETVGSNCVATAGNGRTVYVYDGLGQRVQRVDASGSVTTFVYDAMGQMAAEYGTGSAAGTEYVTADWLGTTRLVMGQLMERHEFGPWGVELASTSGGADTVRQKYTGQERDGESKLDYLHARFYSPLQGRFLGVDPDNAGVSLGDPQSWNGYGYVSGNPLMLTDPDGEGIFGVIGAIVGGIFGGPWGSLAGSAAGNGLDAAIWGPGAVGIPGTPLSLGSLISCGGPLGNCGTLGSGPWSEGTGLGDVKDPGRFIFGAQAQQSTSLSLADRWYEVVGAMGLGIRQRNESFSQCMERTASSYSLGGFIDAVAGTHVNDTFLGSMLLGNSLTGTYFSVFGTTGESAMNGFTTWTNRAALGTVPKVLGGGLTAGRRTASIMSLNLRGKRGPAPQVLARSPLVRSALRAVGTYGKAAGIILNPAVGGRDQAGSRPGWR